MYLYNFILCALYYVLVYLCITCPDALLRRTQVDGNLADLQYLWIDLVTILPIAIFMGRTGPHGRLEPQQPEASLISKSVIGSIGGQVAAALGCHSSLCRVWAHPRHISHGARRVSPLCACPSRI